MWFYRILTELLSSEYEPVLNVATQCVCFYVAKLSEAAQENECLSYLQKTLKADDFRYFTENYFAQINEMQWGQDNNIQTKLFVDFACCVLRNEMVDFFYSSDVKVLVDIYERTMHNINISGKGIDWCIHGVDTLLKWSGYDAELQRYKYDELCQEIKGCVNNAIEHELFEVAGKLDQLLRIGQ